MTVDFKPNLSILPEPQRRLWDELEAVPGEFVLYGGTAIALHLGHRQSVDFDFFGSSLSIPARLTAEIPFLTGATITQQEPNTLSATVERDGPVKVSFFGLPEHTPSCGLHISPRTMDCRSPSLLDLAGTKAAVVQQRAEAKDYHRHRRPFTGWPHRFADRACQRAALFMGRSSTRRLRLRRYRSSATATFPAFRTTSQIALVRAAREVDLDRLPNITHARRNDLIWGRPMKPIPLNAEIEPVVRRIVWFECPPKKL